METADEQNRDLRNWCTVLWIAEDVEHLKERKIGVHEYTCLHTSGQRQRFWFWIRLFLSYTSEEREILEQIFHKHRPLDYALGVKLPTRHNGSGWQIKAVAERQTPGGYDDEQEKMHFRKEVELMARLW